MTVADQQGTNDLAARRARFLEGIEPLRGRLHRYCTRLLGSPLDAEDVVQEVLAETFFRGPVLDPEAGLENWLFRVAHNRSLDVLRRRAVRQRPLAPPPAPAAPVDPVVAGQAARDAFGHLVRYLPPKERVCLVFKDVLDYSLKETAAFLDSSEGAVKAALHRARTKLRAAGPADDDTRDVPGGPDSEGRPEPESEPDAEHARLVSAYAERFNSRDWDGLTAMLKADAGLRVLEVFDGSGRAPFERRYFRNYSRLRVDWRARPVVLAGEPVVAIERRQGDERRLYSVVRIDFEDGRIARVTDYLHLPPYFLESVATALGSAEPAGFEWAHLGLDGPPGADPG